MAGFVPATHHAAPNRDRDLPPAWRVVGTKPAMMWVGFFASFSPKSRAAAATALEPRLSAPWSPPPHVMAAAGPGHPPRRPKPGSWFVSCPVGGRYKTGHDVGWIFRVILPEIACSRRHGPRTAIVRTLIAPTPRHGRGLSRPPTTPPQTGVVICVLPGGWPVQDRPWRVWNGVGGSGIC